MGDSEKEYPEPGDDGYEEWLRDLVGCDNCGNVGWRDEELRGGAMAGSLVEVCDECGYPYFHEDSDYPNA